MRAAKILALLGDIVRDGLLVTGAFFIIADTNSLFRILAFRSGATVWGLIALVLLAGAISRGVYVQLAPIGRSLKVLFLDDM